MSSAFDAYREWLNIPPEEQPPNYYRLLEKKGEKKRCQEPFC